jgi:peptidoglycan/xylan/chitin deacetylase (PgdA/CDA1 family)
VRTPRIAVAVVLALVLSGCTRPAAARPPASADGALGSASAPPTSASAPPTAPPATGEPATTQLPGATRAGLRPPVVTNGPRTGNKVALTFDADMTDSMLYNLASGRVKSYANLKVLDILERQKIPATFFLTGEWAERYPDVGRRIVADPRFEVGNHTYKHQAYTPNCYQLPRIPPNLMTEDVAHTFRVIEPFGGRQTRYFRFPGGCYDEAALQALAPLGVTVIQWDVVSGDPFATAAAPIVHAVLSQVKPGSIIVMHITEANARFTDQALPPILDGLRAKGLEPVTVSELLAS